MDMDVRVNRLGESETGLFSSSGPSRPWLMLRTRLECCAIEARSLQGIMTFQGDGSIGFQMNGRFFIVKV